MTILSFVGNKEYHIVSDEFEIGPDLTMDCGVEHLEKKPPQTYNGIKVVSNVALFFLNRSSFFLQVTRMCIKAWMKFKQIQPLTLE